jgi:hypothetical protein
LHVQAGENRRHDSDYALAPLVHDVHEERLAYSPNLRYHVFSRKPPDMRPSTMYMRSRRASIFSGGTTGWCEVD